MFAVSGLVSITALRMALIVPDVRRLCVGTELPFGVWWGPDTAPVYLLHTGPHDARPP